MGELARRLDARDLWISRGHVWAAGIGAAMVAVIAFSLGVIAGGGEPAHASGTADPLGLSQAPDDRLVELLARVEATADPSGGTTALTFPETLKGGGEERVPEAPKGFAGAATVDAGAVAPPLADARPAGAFTVEVVRTEDESRARALREQLGAKGLPVWLAVERVDGTPAWTVNLGGYATEAEARAAAGGFAEGASELPVLGATQVIRSRAETAGG